MNTLKSAALVVVLLGVLYGVYIVLSKPHMLALPGPTAQPGEDLGPPLVDFSSAGEAGHDDHDHVQAPTTVNASADLPPRGGSYQPNLDSPAMLPPPSLPSTEPPTDPTLASSAGEARHSSYESPEPPGSAAVPPLETSPPATNPPPDPQQDAARAATLTAWSLRRDLQEAEQLVGAGRFREALLKLSPYYQHPDLSSTELGQVVAWLDALAAKVIYSREHLLAAPYEVRRNETLYDIAQKHQVPWMLLMSINRELVNDPQILVPGTQLKVVPGPFRADLRLEASEVTLFLGEMYAGRFPVAIGNEPPAPGAYKVLDKRTDRTYYALDGRTIPANDPSNPYGGWWIDLGREVCLHGSPVGGAPSASTLGCISLSPHDAQDVFGILSLGSEVTIRR